MEGENDMSTPSPVAVYCLTYNHEAYIREALEGFLRQKTDFPFRVVVHDDASTDGTPAILREYERRYPDFFQCVYQTENQFQKGVHIPQAILRPWLTAPYIAVCEGDDYWCDPLKLQMQVDYMRAHPDCTLCVHDTERIDAAGKPLHSRVNGDDIDRDIGAEAIIRACGGGLFHTSAFLCRRDVLFDRPAAFEVRGIGDYPLAIYAACSGRVHYIARVMSRYRVNHDGSWTRRTLAVPEKKCAHFERLSAALESMDDATGRRYHAAFCDARADCAFQLLLTKRDLPALLGDPAHRKRLFRWAVQRWRR